MAACISAWNKAPAPKWQALDIVGKWMLNSLCNHQQQPRLWKINCTLAKGKGNCFARYTAKSCLWAIHLSDVFAKKVLQLSLLKNHTGLLWTAYESRNKEMSKRVRANPKSYAVDCGNEDWLQGPQNRQRFQPYVSHQRAVILMALCCNLNQLTLDSFVAMIRNLFHGTFRL